MNQYLLALLPSMHYLESYYLGNLIGYTAIKQFIIIRRIFPAFELNFCGIEPKNCVRYLLR